MSQNMIEIYQGDLSKILNNLEKYEIFQVINNNETSDENNQYSDSIVKIGTEIAKGFFALKEVRNVFVSSGDPTKLSPLKHGIGTAVRDKGKIIRHDPFLKADIELSKVVSPFLFMQIASIALGQYFMFEINNKLGEISKDIRSIKEYLEDKDLAELEYYEEKYRNIYLENKITKDNIDWIQNRDQCKIKTKMLTFFKIIKRKMEEAKKIKISSLSLTASGSVDKLKKELEKLELDKYIRVYQYTDFLYSFSMYLVWQYYLSENNSQEANSFYQKMLEKDKEFENSFNEILKDYQQMQEQIFNEMEKIQKASDTKAEISKFLTDITKYASYANPMLSVSINSLNDKFELQKKMVDYIKDNEELFSPLKSYIENVPQRKSFMNTKQEVVYIQQDDKVFALIQKEQ